MKDDTRVTIDRRTPERVMERVRHLEGMTLVTEGYHGARGALGDTLISEGEIPRAYSAFKEQLLRWRNLNGAKRASRIDKRIGHAYLCSEGAIAFPELPENPSRIILTDGGSTGVSCFKHIVRCESGRYRRLIPNELDQLQTSPKGWTDTGITDGRRAFCMRSALVMGVPYLIAKEVKWRCSGAKIEQLQGTD